MECEIINLPEIEAEAESKEKISNQFLRKKRQLKQQLLQLEATLPLTLNAAFDRYFQNRPLAYLKIEDKLEHLATLVTVLEKQIDSVECKSDLSRLGGRISFVADRLDEIEAELYQRPRRRRQQGFNLFDFFNDFSKQSKNGTYTGSQEIKTLSEAYKVLGLEEGCSLSELLVTFRKLAKKHHPDTRGGDRSKEQEFRRVLEAYQFIKASPDH